MMKRRLGGIAALLGLLVLLLGIPGGLLVAGGSPIPTSIPSIGDVVTALTSPDDGTLFLGILKFIGWIAWAAFAAMVVLEVIARARGIRAPQIPALAVPQRGAAWLVGAAALAFTATTPLTVANAAPAEAAPPAHTISHAAGVHLDDTQVAPETTAGAQGSETTAKPAPKVQTQEYVVEPGDSLYGISEKLLGDGAKYKQIADLNYGKPQAGGGSLSSDHWIQPGWKLDVPVTPHGPGEASKHVVEPGETLSEIAADELGDAQAYPELFDASTSTTQPDGSRLVDPDLIHPGWTITIPADNAGTPEHSEQETPAPEQQPESPAEDAAPVEPAPEPAPEKVAPEQPSQEKPEAAAPTPAPPAPESEAPSQPSEAETPGEASKQDPADGQTADEQASDSVDEGFAVRTAAGVGALLAAGVLGLLAVRRARQQRRRKPGQPMTMPEGETLHAEEELRAIADPVSVEFVDLALRGLAVDCTEQGRPLPKVRAARLTADAFDLYLAEPAVLPAPWQGSEDHIVWTLPGDAESQLPPPEPADIPAPYPALVTLGHDDEDGHVLVDLEYLGALGITGGDESTIRQVMAALAVELATSRWADDLQVTIVGAYAELEDGLETGRVRYMPAIGRLLDELQHRATRDREELVSRWAGDLNHARVTGAVPGAWTPEILLIPGDVNPAQREKIETLVAELPRVALAAVTSGPSVGEWNIRMTGTQTAVLEPYGLGLRPQMLDDATYSQVLQALAVADEEPEATTWEAQPEPTLAEVDEVISHTAHTPVLKVPTEPVTPPADEISSPKSGEDGPHDPAEAYAAAADEDAVSSATVDDQESVTPASGSDVIPVGSASNDEATGVDQTVVDEAETAPAELEEPTEAEVALLPKRGPQILMLGPVGVVDAVDALVEPTRRNRLTELATIISTHPGCDHTTIDECYYPGKVVSDNTRNTQMSKLRKWFGKTAEGDDFLPRYAAQVRYRFHPDVTSDWDRWQQLLPEGPAGAASGDIEEALKLVRGQPFAGVSARRYSWTETLKQQMIAAIIDAAYELTRRQLIDGRWLAAESTALIGLRVEPGVEALWRMRLISIHARGNTDELERVTDQLLTLAEDWGGDLEPETEELLEQLNNDTTVSRMIAAGNH